MNGIRYYSYVRYTYFYIQHIIRVNVRIDKINHFGKNDESCHVKVALALARKMNYINIKFYKLFNSKLVPIITNYSIRS